MNIDKNYGMKILPIEEELDLPIPMRRTRNNKVNMVDTMRAVRRQVDSLENYARSIPVEDDTRHADLVEELLRKYKEVLAAACEAHATIWR